MTDTEAQSAALALSLEALRDATGWCLLRRPGCNLSARGHDWPAAFEQMRIATEAGEFALPEFPAPRQGSLFE